MILRETVQSHSSKGIDAMTTSTDIDWPAVLADRLTTTSPDVLRDLLATYIHTLMGAAYQSDTTVVRNDHRHHHQASQNESRPGYWSGRLSPAS